MHRVRIILLLLFLGALTNLPVAWALMIWSPAIHGTAPPEDTHNPHGYPPTIAGPDGLLAWWFTQDGFGVFMAEPSGARGTEGGFMYFNGRGTPAYYRAGWPMLSMQSIVNSEQDHHGNDKSRWALSWQEIYRRGVQIDALPGWLYANEGRRLPLLPLFPGFAVNTLVYSVMLIPLLALGRWAAGWRRRRRIALGLCVVCGYDLRGNPAAACPECGGRAHAGGDPR